VGVAEGVGATQGRAVRPPAFVRGAVDSLGSRSNRQPLCRVWSDNLGSRSDHQPLFRAWYDRLNVRFDLQQQPAVESPVDCGAEIVVQTWEPHRECHPIGKCLNH
jgi:hypothetical protein